MVTHGPNFNTVVSQGIGKAKKTDRDKGMTDWSVEQSDTDNLSSKFTILYGSGAGSPKQLQW